MPNWTRLGAGAHLRVTESVVRADGLTLIRLELRSRARHVALHRDDVVVEAPNGRRGTTLALRATRVGDGRWLYDCAVRLDRATADPHAIRLRIHALRTAESHGTTAVESRPVRGPWVFVIPIRSVAAGPGGDDGERNGHRRAPRLLQQTVPFYRWPDEG